jgi:polar amino acid transport system substrate-binding protein
VLLKLFISLLFFSSLTFAEQKDIIRIATHIEPPMVDFIDGKYVGKNIKVISLLAKALNKKLHFLKCPVARCLAMIRNGQADMIVGIRKTPTREEYIGYLERPFDIQHFPLRFYLPFDSKLQIKHAEDLNNLSIGVLRGFTYFDSFDHNHELNKVAVTNHSQLINMLLSKRIDTFIEREESIIPLIDRKTYKTKIKLAQYRYDKSVDSYIGVSKMSHFYKDIDLVSQKLAELLDNGAIAEIFTKE